MRSLRRAAQILRPALALGVSRLPTSPLRSSRVVNRELQLQVPSGAEPRRLFSARSKKEPDSTEYIKEGKRFQQEGSAGSKELKQPGVVLPWSQVLGLMGTICILAFSGMQYLGNKMSKSTEKIAELNVRIAVVETKVDGVAKGVAELKEEMKAQRTELKEDIKAVQASIQAMDTTGKFIGIVLVGVGCAVVFAVMNGKSGRR